MIINEDGERFIFSHEDNSDLSRHIICTNEELSGIREMETRVKFREYIKPRIGKAIPENKISIFDTISCQDFELIRLCRSLSTHKYQCEPVKTIHTAVRILFHASSILGRPYDVNMIANVLSITVSLTQQALKKWFKGLICQSEIKEEHFIPTYLWVFGLPQKGTIRDKIATAIETYGDIYDGRSVFSIARDYTILYYRLCLQLPFSCIPTDRVGIPSEFIHLITQFETRAKISRRKIFMRHEELNNDIMALFKSI